MLVQQDAVTALIEDLRAVVIDVPVRASLPDGWNQRDGPAVVVQSSGTPGQYRGHTAELVRITVYAASMPDARRLASLMEAHLMNPRRVRGFAISPAVGLDVVRDVPDRTRWLAAFTVRAATTRKEMV